MMFKIEMMMAPYYIWISVFCYYITHIICEVVPHEVDDTGDVLSIQNGTAIPVEKFNAGFFQAFFGSFSMIIFSELGDKTFFIAAIMAMKHSRLLVFLGAITALTIMTVLSVGFGLAATFIPKIYTFYISTILFVVFGIKMLWDGFRMSSNETQEELEEVQADLRRREDEAAAKIAKKRGSNTPSTSKSISNQVLPEVEAVDNNTKPKQTENVDKSPQFEKEALTKDPEVGKAKSNSRKKLVKVVLHIILQSCSLTFFAEWGDRSQIATIALAARDNMYGVAVGAVLGHSLCTGLAVLGGRFIAQKISVRTVTIAGGFVFILFAVMTFFLDDTVDKKLPI